MTSYVGKCFDHVSVGDDKHSRTCFCDTDKCNESSETLLLPDEETEVIYNISSSTKEWIIFYLYIFIIIRILLTEKYCVGRFLLPTIFFRIIH